MSQKDAVHHAVKNALVKDGWTILADPYTIVYGRTQLYADLCAERRDEDDIADVIVIEVKSFRGASPMYEFHLALGQYIGYRDLLEELGKPYRVYLALTSEAYETVFDIEAIQVISARQRVRLLIVDAEREEVKAWIE